MGFPSFFLPLALAILPCLFAAQSVPASSKVVVQGKNGTTGVALIEVYNLE